MLDGIFWGPPRRSGFLRIGASPVFSTPYIRRTEYGVYYRGNGSLLWCSIVVRSTYPERSTLLPKHCLIVPNQDDSYSACVNYYCSETGGSLVRLGESGYNENDNFHFLVVYGVSPDEKP